MASDSTSATTPIPLSVLTGFLGSGKTTLLNALLRDDALSDAAIIVNEFGEVGLDHLLVETADENIIEMSSGCLCCTIRGDLIDTLGDLLRKRDAGSIMAFSRVVIETTGLADPAPVLHTIMYHPYLVMRYRLESVVVTADSVNGEATLDAHGESVKQAAVADRIVLTKTDLAYPQRTEALRQRLRQLNPAARILDACAGEASAEALFDAGLYDVKSRAPDVEKWLAAESYDTPEHDHHHHDVNRHDDRIRAWCVTSEEAISVNSFNLFMELLQSYHGPDLLRVKGIVKLSEQPERPVVIHGVQHVFHPPVELESWPAGASRATRLVFITRDIKKAEIESLFRAFSEKISLDAAAFADDDTLSMERKGGLFD